MPSRRFAHVDAVRLACSHARPLSLNHPSAYLEGRLRLFCWADRLRQSVKLRSVVLKPQSPFVPQEDCWLSRGADRRCQSVKPQIPFCSKRKVVALGLFTALRALCEDWRERVCATHFLRPKAVGRVGFKSDLPIGVIQHQMVNRILSPTLPEYRPARWARWRGGGGGRECRETRKACAVGVGRAVMFGWIWGNRCYMETRKAVFSLL